MSDELKQLHRVCFGKPGAKLVVKKNLREFSGFVADDLTAEKAKKLTMVLKSDLKIIKGMLDTCDLSPGGTKAEAAARLVEFLEAPHDSGKKSLVEKAGQKRKVAEKKAGKAAAPAKASPAKGKGKAAAAKPKQERAKTAFMLYCDSRRDKVKAENPDAGFGELTKLLADKWKGISAERKSKYELQAAALKEELAAKVTKTAPAKTVTKSKPASKPAAAAEPAAKRAKKEPAAKKPKKAAAEEEAEEEAAEEEAEAEEAEEEA